MAANQPNRFHLSVTELESLADRIRSRAASALFVDQPLLKSDLALAAEALRTFVRTMKPSDKLEIGNGD